MTRTYPPGLSDGFFGLKLAQRFARDPLGFPAEVAEKCGDYASMRMGPYRTYFVQRPQLIHDVLVAKAKSFRKQPRGTEAFRRIDGNSLIVTEGDVWRRQRRLVQPAFHPRRFDHYGCIAVDGARRMLDHWKPGAVVDIEQEMTHLTLVIIAKALFNAEVTGEAAGFADAVAELARELMVELKSFVPLPDWLPLPSKRRKRAALAVVDAFIRNVIRERRHSGKDEGDLLSMLLLAKDEDGSQMSDQQVRDEAITLFNAGHDSTAAELCWIWDCIAQHPDVEAKIVEELQSVLGGRPPTYGDVANLRFTEMVVKETMRLWPATISLFVREAVEDVQLGEYVIPRGGWVYMMPFIVHRDPRLFPNPLQFDPERFAPGRIDKIVPNSYFPFGAGPHVCIGNTFATMEMVLIVATILQRYHPELAPGQRPAEPELRVSLRPRGGLKMRMVTRELTLRNPAPAGVSGESWESKVDHAHRL
jgi:cytochrome P450